jgi:thiamine-monophosphate kinase
MTPRLQKKTREMTVRDMGETGVIEWIRKVAGTGPSAYVKRGIGDDCAVLRPCEGTLLLATTDTMIEGIHFTADTLSPEDLGWKAMAVNLSDIASMAGTPRCALLSLGLRRETEVRFVESFMKGFEALAKETGVALVGGDTVESPSATVVTLTLLGDCAEQELITRSGAKQGDHIWVTGPVGNAAAGLYLLSGKPAVPAADYPSLVQAHRRPRPRLAMGRALGESGLVHAMIDLSDGIAKDLDHVCRESGTGALLTADTIPLSPEMVRLAAQTGQDPLAWALSGGEDYELLFTASPADDSRVIALAQKVAGVSVAKIGAIVQGDGIRIKKGDSVQSLPPGGYRHFSSDL